MASVNVGLNSTLGMSVLGIPTTAGGNGGEFSRNIGGWIPTEEGQQSFKQEPNIDRKREHRGSAFITQSKLLTFKPSEASFQTPLILDDGACDALVFASWSNALPTKTRTAGMELMPATTAEATMTSYLDDITYPTSARKIAVVVSGGTMLPAGSAGTITITGTWRGTAGSDEEYTNITADGTYYFSKAFTAITAVTTTNFAAWSAVPTIQILTWDVVSHVVDLASSGRSLSFEDNRSDTEVRRFDDIMVSSFELKHTNDTAAMLTINGTGSKSTAVTTEDTATYTTQPRLGWGALDFEWGSSISSTTNDDNVLDYTLTVTRNVDNTHYSPGSQYPSSLVPSIVDVALTVTRVLNSTTQDEIDYMRNHTARACKITYTDTNLIDNGIGVDTAYYRYMEIKLPELYCESPDLTTIDMKQQTITQTYFARYNATAGYTARLTKQMGSWYSFNGGLDMIKNGGGELSSDGTNAQYWTLDAQTEASQTSAQSYSGTYSIQTVDDAGAANEGVYQVFSSNDTAITAASFRYTELYLTCYGKAAVTHTATVSLVDTAVQTDISCSVVSTGWTNFTGWHYANSSAAPTSESIYLYAAASATSGTTYWDNVSVRLLI